MVFECVRGALIPPGHLLFHLLVAFYKLPVVIEQGDNKRSKMMQMSPFVPLPREKKRERK